MQTRADALNQKDRSPLACRISPGAAPAVLFLPGFRSDMGGAKAVHLDRHCRHRGQAFARFDYRGHGASPGRIEDGCLGDWCEDAVAMIDRLGPAPVVLVGSSMGAWIMLLAALERPARVAGLVGVAAAPDFTEDLIRPSLDAGQQERLARGEVVHQPSAYGDPTPITRRLLADGAERLVLRAPLAVRCPVHLLHGQADPDVPWPTSLRLAAVLESPRVTVELVKDGDHRLSRPEDLRRLAAALDRVLEQASALS